MTANDRLDKIEKQIDTISLKMDIIYSKIMGDEISECTGEDEFYEEAKEVVILAGKASASLLQRRLKVGYARAVRLLDMLEADGIIGPADGAQPRDVLTDNLTDNQP